MFRKQILAKKSYFRITRNLREKENYSYINGNFEKKIKDQ